MNKSMLAATSLAALFTAIVSVNTQALDSAIFKVGGFNVLPTFGVDVTYDDNIYASALNETSSFITVFSPSIQAKARIGKTDVLLAYQHLSGNYSSTSEDDYNDNVLFSDVSWELNSRNQFDFNVGFNQGHETRDSNAITNEPDKFDEVNVDVKYTYGTDTSKGRLVLDYEHLDKEFTNNRSTTLVDDRKDSSFGGTFFWGLSTKTDLLFEARALNVDYRDASVVKDSAASIYNLGVAWKATGKTRGIVKVGQIKKDFDDAALTDITLDSWEAEMLFAPKSYSVFSLNTARDAKESDGTGKFIDSKIYGVNWQHGWSNRLTSNAYVSFNNEVYVDDVREDDTNTIGFRVDYNLKTWFDIGVSTDYTDRDSTVAASNYEGSKVALHFLVGL